MYVYNKVKIKNNKINNILLIIDMLEIESGLGLVVYEQKDTDLEPLRVVGSVFPMNYFILLTDADVGTEFSYCCGREITSCTVTTGTTSVAP